jgi:hypothetical protein
MPLRLFSEVARIRIYANAYLLWSDKAANLQADPPNSEPAAPWAFSQEELADEWVRVMPKRFVGHLHFWRNTPRRNVDARSVEE